MSWVLVFWIHGGCLGSGGGLLFIVLLSSLKSTKQRAGHAMATLAVQAVYHHWQEDEEEKGLERSAEEKRKCGL